MRRFVRICLVAVIFMLSGCTEPDTSYTVPTEVYGVLLREQPVFPKISATEVPSSGSALVYGDFSLYASEYVLMQLLQPVDVSRLEKVRDYPQEGGTVEEYREVNGNYKVLTTVDTEGNSRLVGAITLSRYIPTGRGARNRMTGSELDLVYKDIPYETREVDDQERRVYTLNGMQLIFDLKYDVVRCVELLMDWN